MLLFVLLPERSTARKIWPSKPSGLIETNWGTIPPRFTRVLWSKVGLTFRFLALLERTHQIWPESAFTPPMKRLPVVSTSNVPQIGEFGMNTGSRQVTPPSVERV